MQGKDTVRHPETVRRMPETDRPWLCNIAADVMCASYAVGVLMNGELMGFSLTSSEGRFCSCGVSVGRSSRASPAMAVALPLRFPIPSGYLATGRHKCGLPMRMSPFSYMLRSNKKTEPSAFPTASKPTVSPGRVPDGEERQPPVSG